MLRSVLTWLLLFGVLAGLTVRAVPELQEMTHTHEHCSHETGVVAADDHQHDDSCGHDHTAPAEDRQPCPGHHHHGCGCSPLNLTAETLVSVRLCPPAGSLLGVGLADELMPDPPVFEEDAPPLI